MELDSGERKRNVNRREGVPRVHDSREIRMLKIFEEKKLCINLETGCRPCVGVGEIDKSQDWEARIRKLKVLVEKENV